MITTIQKPRNRELIDAVQGTLGIPTARGYTNAVATIIYDVHLLGDYYTPQSAALPRLNTIETDLIRHGFAPLLIGGDKTERLQKIDDDLRTAIRLGRGRTYRIRAKLLLEATARCLPQILNERFKQTLGDRGITITLEP